MVSATPAGTPVLPALGQPEIVGCDVLVVVVVVLGAVVVVDGFVVVGGFVVVVVGSFVVVVVLGGAVVVLVALAAVVVLVGVGRWLPHQRPRAEFEASATSCGHFHEAATAS